jgi:hypothetical protein
LLFFKRKFQILSSGFFDWALKTSAEGLDPGTTARQADLKTVRKALAPPHKKILQISEEFCI